MSTLLRDAAPQILALLAGGLLASLGLTYLARRPRGVAVLGRIRGLPFAVLCASIATAGGGAAYRQVTVALAREGGLTADGLTAGALFLFGLSIGAPLALPGIVLVWSEARARRRTRLKRKDFVPTKDDRRRFAADLARQIREVSPQPREISTAVSGDGGRVLALEGDIDASEGERLTAALRGDLAELGFKRVEGRGGDKDWWSRV